MNDTTVFDLEAAACIHGDAVKDLTERPLRDDATCREQLRHHIRELSGVLDAFEPLAV